MAADSKERIVCQNKRAYHDYFISDEIEAGIVLVGTEIKSLRAGKASLQDSYCEIIDGEMFLRGLHISKYEMGNIFNHDPDRLKKLLLTKHEIIRYNTKKQKNASKLLAFLIKRWMTAYWGGYKPPQRLKIGSQKNKRRRRCKQFKARVAVKAWLTLLVAKV